MALLCRCVDALRCTAGSRCCPAQMEGCLDVIENPFRWKADCHGHPCSWAYEAKTLRSNDHIPENSPTLVGNTSPADQAQPCWDAGPKSSWKGSDPGTVVSCSALAVGQSVGISCDLFRKALNLIRLFTSVPYLNLLDPPQEAALLLVKSVRLYFLT